MLLLLLLVIVKGKVNHLLRASQNFDKGEETIVGEVKDSQYSEGSVVQPDERSSLATWNP
jgi:hypothetical protein